MDGWMDGWMDRRIVGIDAVLYFGSVAVNCLSVFTPEAEPVCEEREMIVIDTVDSAHKPYPHLSIARVERSILC